MNDIRQGSSPSELLKNYIMRKAGALEDAYVHGSPWAIRQLAQLRRANGKEPGSIAETWSIEFEDLPEALVGHGDMPSPGEWAVHIALTLYATHQQSQSERMYVRGREYGFGKSVRKLVVLQGDRSSLQNGQMPQRLSAMVTAQSVEELSHYARQLVGLLRSNAIPVDYGTFGKQVYLFQFPSARNSVCLQWARDYAEEEPVELEHSTSGDEDR